MDRVAVGQEVLPLGNRGFGNAQRHLRVADGVGKMRDHAGFRFTRKTNAQ